MAKKKSEPTAAQTALAGARQKLELANAADDKASTEKTQAALETAKAAVKAADAVVCRERFVNVGGNRVKKVRLALRNFSAVAAPRSYQYDETDVVKAESAIMDEAKKAIAKLRNALTKGPAAVKAGDDFTF